MFHLQFTLLCLFILFYCFVRYGIASDSTGSYLAAVDGSPGYIYTSSDYGVTWTSRTSAGAHAWYENYYYYFYYVIYNILFFIMFHLQFTLLCLYIILFYCFVRVSITSDSTGRYLAAGDYNGYIYTSSDYGVTWITRSSVGTHNWYVNYYIIIVVLLLDLS